MRYNSTLKDYLSKVIQNFIIHVFLDEKDPRNVIGEICKFIESNHVSIRTLVINDEEDKSIGSYEKYTDSILKSLETNTTLTEFRSDRLDPFLKKLKLIKRNQLLFEQKKFYFKTFETIKLFNCSFSFQ